LVQVFLLVFFAKMSIGDYKITLMPPSFSPWEPAKTGAKQIAVLMSGGVDSSVTAHLLKKNGWDVLGITMRIPISCTTSSRGCCGADAALVCSELDIPHYFVDVTEAFQKLIIEPFQESYAKGETPNPCVDCNTLLKFSLVWDFLEETFGIRCLATGHYAKVVKTNEHIRLARAKDKTKDQSYFIYGIPREKLESFVLPLGDLTKNRVRSIAAELDLSVADKAESMELCFAGEGDYRVALNAAEADRPGDLTDMHGNKIGTHVGVAHYTLGQRKGVGFAGGKPLYVGRIDARTNTVALGTREEVSSRTVKVNQINVLAPEDLLGDDRYSGKIRSYGSLEPCTVIDLTKADVTVEFDEPQFAPCPGQRLVLYDNDDNIVAGGTIVAA
jgi:tRNA-specific 2-thiouridylase